MKVEIRHGRYPGEWKLSPLTDGWSNEARTILGGFDKTAGDIFSDLISFEPTSTYSSDDVLAVINEEMLVIQGRFERKEDVLLVYPDDHRMTYGEALDMVRDFLRLAVWLYSSALESLSKGDIATAIHAYGKSMYWHGLFRAHFATLSAVLETPPSGPAHALAQREDQLLKPGWLEHCRAVIQSGKEIRQLNDLLNTEGYDPRVTRITDRTLKSWAKDVGISFKPGRKKHA